MVPPSAIGVCRGKLFPHVGFDQLAVEDDLAIEVAADDEHGPVDERGDRADQSFDAVHRLRKGQNDRICYEAADLRGVGCGEGCGVAAEPC